MLLNTCNGVIFKDPYHQTFSSSAWYPTSYLPVSSAVNNIYRDVCLYRDDEVRQIKRLLTVLWLIIALVHVIYSDLNQLVCISDIGWPRPTFNNVILKQSLTEGNKHTNKAVSELDQNTARAHFPLFTFHNSGCLSYLFNFVYYLIM